MPESQCCNENPDQPHCHNYEDLAYVTAYASIAFWAVCVLMHITVLLVYAKLENMQVEDCDTPLIRFVKKTPITFHANAVAGDLLRVVASLILLKALHCKNTELLVNFLRYKYVELFQLLLLFTIRCFGSEANALVKVYFLVSLALDVALMHVIFYYTCEILSSQ